jgi:hypothetical protein
LFECRVACQAAWDLRPHSSLNPLLHHTNLSAVFSLEISEERNSSETVTIWYSREQ